MNKIELIEEIVKNNAKNWKIRAFFLFGSTATGLDSETSDIDVAVIFEPEVEERKKSEIIKDIKRQIFISLNREVDVVEIDERFSKPILFYNAIVNGIPIFISDEELYKRLVLRAICEMEDFSSIGLKWKVESCKKMLTEVEEWVRDLDTQREE